MIRPLLFPVYCFTATGAAETLATFFESSDAETFAMHPERDGFEKRHAYLAEPKWDRREGGYRPAPKPSGYREWLASLEPKELPDGRFQVAA